MKLQQATGHTAYHHVGHTAYHHVGEIESFGFWEAVRLAGIGLAAYHGYKRNSSVGWAIGWALVAGFSPPTTSVLVPAIAVAQGFGKRKGS